MHTVYIPPQGGPCNINAIGMHQSSPYLAHSCPHPTTVVVINDSDQALHRIRWRWEPASITKPLRSLNRNHYKKYSAICTFVRCYANRWNPFEDPHLVSHSRMIGAEPFFLKTPFLPIPWVHLALYTGPSGHHVETLFRRLPKHKQSQATTRADCGLRHYHSHSTL